MENVNKHNAKQKVSYISHSKKISMKILMQNKPKNVDLLNFVKTKQSYSYVENIYSKIIVISLEISLYLYEFYLK